MDYSGEQDISIPPSLFPVNKPSDSHALDDSESISSPDSLLLRDSIVSPYGFDFPLKSAQEARYLMHYIQELAPWVDLCDPSQHFSLEVPKRARHFPLLAYSILAFSSRHLVLMTGEENSNSESYHSCALRILIPILDDPVLSLDENLLAAVVLLRLYEEMTDTDTGTHLLGGSRLLNDVPDFAAHGGLSEAASWIILRQDLHVSLIKKEPLRVNLDKYKYSKSFSDTSDESLANRAVLLCCQVLATAFGNGPYIDHDTWTWLTEEVSKWHKSLPSHYRPYYVDSDTSRTKMDSAFPIVWMMNPAQVLGYQHYCLARVLLHLAEPKLWVPTLKAIEDRMLAEQAALDQLRIFLGLAIHNPSVVGAKFTAHHTLFACGCLLTDEVERQETLRFLDSFSTSEGWPTKRLKDRLSVIWYKTSDG